MTKDHIIITGEKETFLIRVLMKKLGDSGIPCSFVTWGIDSINKAWEGTCLVILYMDSGFLFSDKTIHFISDKLSESDVQIITIGEENDIKYIVNRIPKDLMYKAYTRPIDNDEFVSCVSEAYGRIAAGEYKKTLLIVDDDPNYLNLVRTWLRDNYKVSMANSGLQAIKLLGKNKVDLILLDYEMPVTSGPQVLEMLRSDPDTSSIPVMFLTGKSDKESVMAVLSLKPEGYFLKTIEKNELLEKLDQYFILHK